MNDNLLGQRFLEYFELSGKGAQLGADCLLFDDTRIPVRNGIPRFTSDDVYTDNFALLRRQHATLQLDSTNGTTDRRDTMLRRTNWRPEFFRDKLVLECGCGAGPDTEILLSLGARVVSVDLSGVDIAQQNIGRSRSVQFVQASIEDLPLRKRAFDIVFCHRVLQHTKDPRRTLGHILQFVKSDGAVFVHSYSSSAFQRLRWKYALLPLTRRLPPRLLYRIISVYAKPAFYFTSWTGRSRLGRRFNWVFVPFLNYRHAAKFRGMSNESMLEYAIHDTFDALSPSFDRPLPASIMQTIAASDLERPFEVIDDRTITLLRSIVR